MSPIHVLANCKVSEKSNERFSRNCVTDERTNGRMDGRTDRRDSLGLQRLRRETKNQTIPMKKSEEKWEKPHF